MQGSFYMKNSLYIMGNNQANRKEQKRDIATELIDVNYAD